MLTEKQRTLLKNRFWRLNNLYKIKDKNGKCVTFKMTPEQLEYFDGMHDRNVILKARQLGFTTEVCIIQLDLAIFHKKECALIAHSLPDAERLFRNKTQFAYQRMTDDIKLANPLVKETTSEYVFSKGGSVTVSTSFRGGTLYSLHVSEFGKICAKYPEKAKEIVTGAFEAVPLGGVITLESTAEGRAGYFYDYCQDAEMALLQGKELSNLDWKFFFFSWWKNPQYSIDPVEPLPQRLVDYFVEMEAKHGVVVNERQKAWYYAKEKTLGDDMKREYPDTLTFDNFYRQYRRGSTGFSAVHKLLDACWVDRPTIIDGDEDRESTATTAWEKAVTKLMKKHWAKIKDADRRNMIGRYSALLIQVRDSRDWSEPIDVDVVKKLGSKALVKLIPAWEPQIKPGNLDIDTWSETYGQPVSYQFNEQPIGDEGTYSSPRSVQVHPDRIILLCEGSEDENILSGIPLLEAGYNDLLDIEKTKGGSAEGFLKNASRPLAIAFDKETNMEALKKAAVDAGFKDLGEALNDKVTKMNRGTDAALVMQAGTPSVLSVMGRDEAAALTMTEFQLLLAAKYPDQKGFTREEYDAVADDYLARKQRKIAQQS